MPKSYMNQIDQIAKLPEWRDTPEREEWLFALTQKKPFHCGRIFLIACVVWCVVFPVATRNIYNVFGGPLIALLTVTILDIVDMLKWRIAVCRRHHRRIWEWRWPHRRDISKEIKSIMEQRSSSAGEYYVALWRTAEHGKIAQSLCAVGNYPNKAIYPQDPLELFMFFAKDHGDIDLDIEFQLQPFFKEYPQSSDKLIIPILDMLWIKRTRFHFQFQDLVELCWREIYGDVMKMS